MRTSLPAMLVAAVIAVGCGSRDQPQTLRPRPAASASAYPVTIHQPPKLTSIETGDLDPTGKPRRVACVTCHSQRKRDALPAGPEELSRFHAGLQMKHGTLACGACHTAGRSDGAHLADGTRLEMAEVVRLCGQCHGPQLRSYEHGAHGGMNGHWDLKRGPRIRNVCVDCHDPHAPAFPAAEPVHPPRDRFLPPPEGTPHE